MAGRLVAPPGLEYLLQVNGLFIKETSGAVVSFAYLAPPTGKSIFQSSNTYDLFGTDGQLVYQATEKRKFFGPRMDLRVTNTKGINVLNLLVPLKWCSLRTKLQVSSSSGEILGYIVEQWTSLTLSFHILDPSGLVCLKVKGPGWRAGFMSDLHYKVLSADKTTQIGVITRLWRGLHKEMFSSKDNYTINFPMDLHISMKAMLMACALFIDLLNEERQQQSQTASHQ